MWTRVFVAGKIVRAQLALAERRGFATEVHPVNIEAVQRAATNLKQTTLLLGDHHPRTLASLRDLAEACRKSGDEPKARLFMSEATTRQAGLQL